MVISRANGHHFSLACCSVYMGHGSLIGYAQRGDLLSISWRRSCVCGSSKMSRASFAAAHAVANDPHKSGAGKINQQVTFQSPRSKEMWGLLRFRDDIGLSFACPWLVLYCSASRARFSMRVCRARARLVQNRIGFIDCGGEFDAASRVAARAAVRSMTE